jgi:outer membrane receptor protein involved in Fe transport
MKIAKSKTLTGLMIGVSAMAVSAGAYAQEAAQAPSAQDDSVVVVTGVTKRTNRLDTSVSVSAITVETLQNNIVRGTSEAIRSMPGIRTESSAGGGNSNIGVRGIPVSTGGAKWVQLQEDGLPIMLFGDFDFAPSDGFFKADNNLARIESVRGGSASTLTTNGPGAIINFISQTGKKDGGSFAVESGLGYKDFKIDGGYGGHLDPDTYYYIGGHYQTGGDYRDLGYNGIEGGQFKVSLTHEFGDENFVRVWAKVIDKKDATYMPQAMAISDGKITGGVPGLDAGNESMQSPFLNNYLSVDNGTVLHQNGADGFNVKSKSLGGEVNFNVGNGWVLNDKFKYAAITGGFAAPFTNSVMDADTFLAANYPGKAVTFFNGVHAGNNITSAALRTLNGNPYLADIAQFDVTFNDMGNFANDLKLSRTFGFDGAALDVTFGYFHMTQNFKQAWHWQDFLTDVSNDAALIEIAGVTQGGQLGYNDGFGWNGTNRHYDLVFTNDAPYVAGSLKAGDLTVDASVRRDQMNYSGNITEAAGGKFDVNGDGVISVAESNVSINQGNQNIGYMNFNAFHTSYSLGANYKLAPTLAVFARYSNGASFNGERQDGSGAYNPKSGALVLEDSFVDVVKQYEVGVKWQTKSFLTGKLDLGSTYFHADTEESQTNTTQVPPVAYNIAYESYGLENEAVWRLNDFTFNGTVTWTHARITEYASNPSLVGKKPRRQADFIWNLNAAYKLGPTDFGVNVNGTTDSYAGFANLFIQPGYTVVGAYLNWHISDSLTASINGNNILDEVGVTEAEEDAGRYWKINSTAYNVTSGRSIGGRTVSARLKYTF